VSDVAPDGSPVDVYLALPFEADLARVRTVIPPDATILDLGSGPGRLSNPLAADGHDVVAVDDSAEMLSPVVGASTVLADVWQLDLGRRFDVVLALSHLINDRSPARRIDLLQVPPSPRRYWRDRLAALSTRLVAARGIRQNW
jgi:SAM-dependent methyltransferase